MKGGHYSFYVEAQHRDHITYNTTIAYQGVRYNMDSTLRTVCATAR